MNDLQRALDIGSARLFSREKTGFKWSDGDVLGNGEWQKD